MCKYNDSIFTSKNQRYAYAVFQFPQCNRHILYMYNTVAGFPKEEYLIDTC